MTNATHAKHHFAIVSSQRAEMLARLRLRMADLERGKRIKDLRAQKAERLGRKVTQQAMADYVDVSLRAAQEWEYGGGIEDDHLPRLLEFLETDSNYLLRGQTPDPFVSADEQFDTSDSERLRRIEEKLDKLARRITDDETDEEADHDRGLPPPEPPPIVPAEDEPPSEGEAQRKRDE